MPNRMLREGLRSSGPINGLTDPAHRLYTHLLITADDFGLVEWTPGWVKAHAVPALSWTLERTAELMAELVAAKLVRVYEAKGKAHAAVEKWEQRRNAKFPKFPAPPWGFDGEDTHIIGGYVPPRARTGAAAEKPVAVAAGGGALKLPRRWWDSEGGITEAGGVLGLTARPGESWPQFKGRINDELERRKGAPRGS